MAFGTFLIDEYNVRLYKKIKPMLDVLMLVDEHLKTSQAGVLKEIATDIEQVEVAMDQTSRNLLIKSAARTALHVLAVVVTNLTPTEKYVITDFVESRLPEEWHGE